ncbi:GGDEF domain-containing protein [Rhizobium alvei]|uniref:GGDEF domain-containing protein n=1 Tax=Rhizobium alvei TaxID=1132659 RepID=A0ABT8YQY3_9HYPH|nr:GGDEF domain-containing protein [Rhizobium alvei]MDO6965931.1 GGDEF domain-containing protein [Rhizobium alvei]
MRAIADIADALQDKGLAILDFLPIPISYATLADRIIRFNNRAFHDTFGYLPPTCITVEDWVEQYYPLPEQQQTARETWRDLWADGLTGVSEIRTQVYQVKRRDGTISTFENRGILLHDLKIGVALFEDISERVRLETELRAAAYQDPLTGLANRRDLERRWDHIRNRLQGTGAEVALAMIDLDGFKLVNDNLGHAAGDFVLMETAKRLRSLVGENDILCRMGGDEFVIVIPDFAAAHEIASLCASVQAVMSRPMSYRGEQLRIGATIGATLSSGDNETLDQLMRKADTALYHGKATGKGTWHLYGTTIGRGIETSDMALAPLKEQPLSLPRQDRAGA